jgi:hypothetical protein
MVGVHVATLLPLISDALTTVLERLRLTDWLVRIVQVPLLLDVPALYRMLPAAIPRPFLRCRG